MFPFLKFGVTRLLRACFQSFGTGYPGIKMIDVSWLEFWNDLH